jgi:hypothetical protein
MLTSEEKIGRAVMQIASQRPNKLATFNRCRAEIPALVNLTAAERATSGPRAPEPMWHQIVRNIKSHHGADTNFIDRGLLEHVSRTGYRITPKGEAFLKKNGLI